MAAMERMGWLPLQGALVTPLSRMGLMALPAVQPPAAGTRHKRQVPTSNWVGSTGSTRNGAGVLMV